MSDKILVVEDTKEIRQLLQIFFTSQGYEVHAAATGTEAIEMSRKVLPHIAILDINLPDMLGYDVGKAMRANPRTNHIPIVFLTARGEKVDRLIGLGEVEAEGFYTKPFDMDELHTFVKTTINRSRQRNLTHPITNLPTAELINDQYRRLLASQSWGLALARINGIEAFTQTYGAVACEEVLRFFAMLMNDTVGTHGAGDEFIGHLSVGATFLLTSAPGRIQTVCDHLTTTFDAEIGKHYDFKDLRNGGITARDDVGNDQKLPLMSLSIGVLTDRDGPFYDIRELSEAAEERRQHAVAHARDHSFKSFTAYTN